MLRNSVTLLSRDDLDRLAIRRERARARAAYQADPTPANKARYLRAYRAALTWAMADAGIERPQGLINAAVADLDALAE